MKKNIGKISNPSQFTMDYIAQKYIQHLDPAIMSNLIELINFMDKNRILKVSFKQKHPKAKLPFRKNITDTGYDIFSVEDKIIPAKSNNTIETGIEISNIPPGYWYLILPRSGLGFLHGIQPHLGVIDNGYRGDLAVKLYNFSDKDYQVSSGDRIAQLAFFPLISIEPSWSSETTETTRGTHGFGSSGK